MSLFGLKIGNNTVPETGFNGTVTSVNVTTANGVSATGGPITTSGSFTFSLGAITPTTVNGMTITTNSGTLAVGNAKSVVFPASCSWGGTDGAVYVGPGQSADLGYMNVPPNSKSVDYQLVALDTGKQILHPASDANNRQFTIPKNATVPFALGTFVTFVNMSANDITIIIDTDVLTFVDTGVVTTITVPQYNTCTIDKTGTTEWLAFGTAGCSTS